MAHEPKTLAEAIVYFQNPDNCIDYMALRRWPNGRVACPTCERTDVSFVPSRRLWQCKTRHPKAQFSIKTGTILEDSPLGLEKWLPVMWMVANCKNGVSSWEIHRSLGVTQKTAWFMLHRIRLGMQQTNEGSVTKLGGPDSEVEVDETFVGGKVKNMHKSRRVQMNNRLSVVPKSQRAQTSGPYANKTAVVGMLDRDARQVRATVVPMVKRPILQAAILKEIAQGTHVYTDESSVYINIAFGLHP